ncbi:MAG: hypothetical protein IPM57_02475 [Oligoflexia bacterium]|nr:hypothetical protein [Oligoflexia bacterium]
MNRPSTIIFNFVIYMSMLLLAISLQTSLFHWLIGSRSTIQIALVIVTYICLYRSTTEALLFTFLASYCLGLISTMLQSISVFATMVIFLFTMFVKHQLYTSNTTSFSRVALANILIFHVVSWVASGLFEDTTPQLRPLDWVLEILITALFVKILFIFFQKIDEKTKRLEFSELDG